jgi:glycosyltransferase involved in cell wall biosynthesis
MVAVTINGRFLTRPATGVDRFAMELLRAWLPQRDAADIKIALPANSGGMADPELGVRFERSQGLTGHAWEQLQLPSACGDDVLLSLCNTSPVVRRRQLVVLHDAGVAANPSTYSLAYRTWHSCLFALLMRRAAVVATVSKFSATELQRLVGGRTASIEVIYEGGEHVLRAPSDARILDRLDLRNRPYVLAVGSRSPNKNFGAVARAAALLSDLDLQFVAAGGSNSRVFAAVDASNQQLVNTGYVSDGELRALYENARCFVFPSLYEGFGLPPLEAMHCGCPVIVSRRASLPEVCGDGALYCDPADPRDIAEQIRRVVTSPALSAELREAGLARARTFSWHKAAACLDELLAHNFGRAA